MSSWPREIRHAWRSLWKSPGFALVVLVVLALGIGANTAIFSIVEHTVLRSLPFPHADRLVTVKDVQPNYGEAPMSYAEWRDLEDSGRIFDALAAYFPMDVNYAGGELPERFRMLLVSPQYFEMLGDTIIAGRGFTAAEERPDGPRAVIVSQAFWKTRLGGRRDAIGKVIHFSGRTYTLVGVVKTPSLALVPSIMAYVPLSPNAPWRNRGSHYLEVMARLPAHASLERIRSEVDALATNLDRERGTDHGLRIHPLREALLAGQDDPLGVLFVAVFLVLLIAAGNVGNLLLVRAARRRPETILRRALGARTQDLMRQLLCESLVLGLASALPGVLLAAWLLAIVRPLIPSDLLSYGVIALDLRAVVYAVSIALVVAILAGLIPALIERRSEESSVIGSARVMGGRKRDRRIRDALVVGELALSLVLLIGAGLMIRSLRQLLEVDPGFRAAGLLSFQISLPETRYRNPQQKLEFAAALTTRLNRLDGVTASAVASGLPFANGMNGDVDVEGQGDAAEDKLNAEKRVVSRGYFRVMGISLRRGRLFSPSDRESSQRVVVISEALARHLWPHDEALGKRIRSLTCVDQCWEEVVGVVGNVREAALGRAGAMEIYYPLSQAPLSRMQVVFRTKGDPRHMVEAGRRVVADLDPLQPVYDVASMTQRLATSLSDRRLIALLLGGFAALALLLATVGVGGVISYAVGQRTREIGLRIALGLQPRSAVSLLVKEGIRLGMAGLAIGLVAAVVLTRFLRGFCYGVSPTDPASFVTTSLLLLAGAVAASWIPARRASRIDPMEALRHE